MMPKLKTLRCPPIFVAADLGHTTSSEVIKVIKNPVKMRKKVIIIIVIIIALF